MNITTLFDFFSTKEEFKKFVTDSDISVTFKILDGNGDVSIESSADSTLAKASLVIATDEIKVDYQAVTTDAFETLKIEVEAKIEGFNFSGKVLSKGFFSEIITNFSYPEGVSLEGEVVHNFDNWPNTNSELSMKIECGKHLVDIKEGLPNFLDAFSEGYLREVGAENFKLINSNQPNLDENSVQHELSFQTKFQRKLLNCEAQLTTHFEGSELLVSANFAGIRSEE